MKKDFRFTKNSTLSLRQKAYQDMKNAIIKGDLKPGERLLENEISSQMGISRGPIREALRSLEQEGLVISHPYRASIVAEISDEEVKKVYVPIRRTIETYAAKKAASILKAEEYDYLYNIIEKMKEASTNDDLYLISDLDLQFHRYIIEKSEIPSIKSIWDTISSKIHIRLLVQGIQNTSFQNVVQEHIQFIEVIKEGIESEIEKHLESHIT